jgi:hypothetical protein
MFAKFLPWERYAYVIKRETNEVSVTLFGALSLSRYNSIILVRAIESRSLFRLLAGNAMLLPRREFKARIVDTCVCTRIDAPIEPVAPPRRKHSRPAIYQHQQLALAAFTTLLIRSSINARPWRGVH